MATTNNKNYTLPAVGGDFGSWGNELNGNLSIIDNNLAGVVTINCTGNANVIASPTQAQNLIHNLTGTLTGNIDYVLPAVGGFYIIFNQCTGAFTLNVACAGGGVSVLVTQGYPISVWSDSVNMFPMATVSATNWLVNGNEVITGSSTIGAGLTTTTATLSGVLTASDGIVLSNATYLYGKNTSGAPCVVLGLNSANTVDIVNGGGNQIRFVNQGYTSAILTCDNAGNIVTTGALSLGSNLLVPGSAQVNSNIVCSGEITAVGAMLSNGMISDAGSGATMYLGPSGTDRVQQYTTNWEWIWDTTNGNLVWFTPSGPYWYMRNDFIAYNNIGPVGGIGAYENFSDVRSKTNMTPSHEGLQEVLQLKPMEFTRLPRGKDVPVRPREVGFIAQDVKAVLPLAVRTSGIALADGTGGLDGPEPSLSLTNDAIIAALVNTCKTLHARIEALEIVAPKP